MPGKAVESTLPPGSASQRRYLAALPGRNASVGKRADREPRTGGGWKKSYPAGQKPATVKALRRGAPRRDPWLSPLPSMQQ